jgi:hypothetical protein
MVASSLPTLPNSGAAFYHELSQRVYVALGNSRMVRLDIDGNVEAQRELNVAVFINLTGDVYDVAVESTTSRRIATSVRRGDRPDRACDFTHRAPERSRLPRPVGHGMQLGFEEATL